MRDLENASGLSLLRERFLHARNRVVASARFQQWVPRIPVFRWIARDRSRRAFDLVAGFVYSQVLLAAIESGLLAALAAGPVTTAALAARLGLSMEATLRLLRAAASLDLVVDSGPGRWMLGETGAVIQANAGLCAMIRHHRLLYADLAEPLDLLRDDRAGQTALSEFWDYRGSDGSAAAYSALMAATQTAVAEQVLGAFRFKGIDSLLDVGGGSGVFAGAVAARHPHMRVGVFDRASVVSQILPAGMAVHAGDFFADALPEGYRAISLVRILHDHDDAPVLALLRSVRAALPPGGRLIVAEPMAGPGPEARVGHAYFGFYLWAMRSGRARTAAEIGRMLESAGFARWRRLPTPLPVVASLLVATH